MISVLGMFSEISARVSDTIMDKINCKVLGQWPNIWQGISIGITVSDRQQGAGCVPSSTIVIPSDIPNVEDIVISIENSDEKDKALSRDIDLLTFKVTQLQELTKNHIIQQAIIDSNTKFQSMENVDQYILEKDKEWINTPKNQISPFMGALIENNISKILKEKQKIPTEQFGDVLFPEIIVTNEFGANVAVTGRTEDYNKGDEIWWIKAEKQSVQFRSVNWDDSTKIYSADIVIKIENNKGKFIGVLKAATPVR